MKKLSKSTSIINLHEVIETNTLISIPIFISFQACAPRYVYFSFNNRRREPVGTCFTATDSFSKFSEYSPSRTGKRISTFTILLSYRFMTLNVLEFYLLSSTLTYITRWLFCLFCIYIPVSLYAICYSSLHTWYAQLRTTE